MIEVLQLRDTDGGERSCQRVLFLVYMLYMASEGPRVKSNLGHGKARIITSGLEDLPRRAQSVPSSPADREDPCEQGLQWKDIGEANIDESFLYPNRGSDEECPVVRQHLMEKADQQKYMLWIEKSLDFDRRLYQR